jgi:hypothetical protein
VTDNRTEDVSPLIVRRPSCYLVSEGRRSGELNRLEDIRRIICRLPEVRCALSRLSTRHVWS